MTLPIKLPVTVSIFAVSAWIPDHCAEEVPKLYAESVSGTIALASVVDFVRLAETEVAVITLEAKLPDPSRKTKLFAAFVLADATLIVVLPDTPSAFVSVIPEFAVTWNVR